MGGNQEILITQFVLLFTTVLGIVVQLYRENRARKWAREDREQDIRDKLELKEQLEDVKPAILVRSTDVLPVIKERKPGFLRAPRKDTDRTRKEDK